MSENNDRKINKMSFSELILGFASAALYYTGDSPIDGKLAGDKDLDLARQNIEIVQMLSAKTKGNLTPDERKLVDEILTDLDKKYEEALKI